MATEEKNPHELVINITNTMRIVPITNVDGDTDSVNIQEKSRVFLPEGWTVIPNWIALNPKVINRAYVTVVLPIPKVEDEPEIKDKISESQDDKTVSVTDDKE